MQVQAESKARQLGLHINSYAPKVRKFPSITGVYTSSRKTPVGRQCPASYFLKIFCALLFCEKNTRVPCCAYISIHILFRAAGS